MHVHCGTSAQNAIVGNPVSQKKLFWSTSDHHENNKHQSVGVALFVHLISHPARRVFPSATPSNFPNLSGLCGVQRGDGQMIAEQIHEWWPVN